MAIKVKSFPPVTGDRPTVLILGCKPGRESMRVGQYYAHRGNAFWHIMGRICGAHGDIEYIHRIERLKQAGVALWDVLCYSACRDRLGSEARQPSEVANRLSAFLATHRGIRCICFNGVDAARAFEKHVKPHLTTDLLGTTRLITLPSSSGANARLSVEAKFRQWQIVAQFLDAARPGQQFQCSSYQTR